MIEYVEYGYFSKRNGNKYDNMPTFVKFFAQTAVDSLTVN